MAPRFAWLPYTLPPVTETTIRTIAAKLVGAAASLTEAAVREMPDLGSDSGKRWHVHLEFIGLLLQLVDQQVFAVAGEAVRDTIMEDLCDEAIVVGILFVYEPNKMQPSKDLDAWLEEIYEWSLRHIEQLDSVLSRCNELLGITESATYGSDRTAGMYLVFDRIARLANASPDFGTDMTLALSTILVADDFSPSATAKQLVPPGS